MILVSGTEPSELKAVGVVSRLPERWGADVIIPGARLVAMQRKSVDDLLASLADGRMERELTLLRKAGCGALLIEGRPMWSSDGRLDMNRRQFTVKQWWGVVWSAALVHGLSVIQTSTLRETVDCVRCLGEWLTKAEHRGLTVRPTANTTSAWGHATDKDWSRHLLQSFPGVGPVLADAIFDRFGRAPVVWGVEKDDLGQVDGVGPKRLTMLWDALDGGGGRGGDGEAGPARGVEADAKPRSEGAAVADAEGRRATA